MAHRENTPTKNSPDDLAAVEAALATFVGVQRERLAPLGEDVARFVDSAAAFVAGGKRMRPAFCLAGWRVATGSAPDDAPPASVVTAAAAWEWLQGSALVHDDLMDASDTRRGRPSVHRDHETRHTSQSRTGDPVQYGLSVAVLLGDLMLSWCDEMLRSAATVDGTFASPEGRARLESAFAVLDRCKTEVVAGQLLDVAGQTRDEVSARDAMLVVRYKSAKYTIERPLHLGAALGGGDRELADRLSAVALPLGEAFQLRDDVLGVFGDGARTRKPVGDDLREGKWTLLVAETRERLDVADLVRFDEALGDANLEGHALEDVLGLVRRSGALDRVEHRIDELADEAMDALGDLPLSDEARCALGDLATFIVARQH